MKGVIVRGKLDGQAEGPPTNEQLKELQKKKLKKYW